jgi:phosphoribosylformimino-5-aminoimidazole carboxamide ribotide isomerase
VIASGGISSLDDIAALMVLDDPPLEGAICGRALYDGRIDPASLFQLVASGGEAAC